MSWVWLWNFAKKCEKSIETHGGSSENIYSNVFMSHLNLLTWEKIFDVKLECILTLSSKMERWGKRKIRNTFLHVFSFFPVRANVQIMWQTYERRSIQTLMLFTEVSISSSLVKIAGSETSHSCLDNQPMNGRFYFWYRLEALLWRQ